MKNLMKTLSLASSGCGRRTINLLTRVDTILLASFPLTTAMRVQDSFDAFSMTLRYVFQSAYHGNRNQGSRPSRIIRMLCSAVRYSIRIPLGIEEEEEEKKKKSLDGRVLSMESTSPSPPTCGRTTTDSLKCKYTTPSIRGRRHVFNEAASTKPDFLPFLRLLRGSDGFIQGEFRGQGSSPSSKTLSFKQIFNAFILVRDVKIIVINISIRSSKRKNVF